MKKYILKLAILAGTAALLQSCGTTKAQRTVAEKMANEPAIANEQSLISKQKDAVESAPSLSETQKTQLVELRTSAQEKMKDIDQQSLKLRDILVRNLVAADYGPKKANEVRVIKNKLSKLNTQRFDITLRSIEKAQAILGHQIRDNETMMNNFLERDFDSRGNR
ncbi:MAG: hypothetical protein H7256_02475 [Bdellovibrio sp.]|nr:hypothetical protein [Bdellovibrio sp.]